MGILYCGTQRIAPVVIEGGGSSGKYQLLQRIKDDSNNEIGTVSGFFTDSNDVEYAVVCLDAQYRGAGIWISPRSAVTNLPIYAESLDSWWYDDAHETATENTQLILDYCTASGSTSEACSICRSKSFIINGTTYYGQLPNMREVFDMWVHRKDIETLDISASTATNWNFSTARSIWSSTQSNSSGTQAYIQGNSGGISGLSKSNGIYVCPVLELPNA